MRRKSALKIKIKTRAIASRRGKGRERTKKSDSDFIKSFSINLAIVALIAGMNWHGLSAIGRTLAYYNDTETSTENAHIAGSLDFSLSAVSDFAPEAGPETDTAKTIALSNDGSLDFQYTIKTKGAAGGLCSSLNLAAKLDGSEKYNGPLSEFDEGPFVFDGPESWDFIASLTRDGPDLAGETCVFDFEYSGWQTDLAGPPPAGFNDTEIISNAIIADNWEADSCVTEHGDTISTVITGTNFGANGHNLVIASGGELKSLISPHEINGALNIETDCDITVESGGKITALKGNGRGGAMTISARNFTVDVGGIVSANSTADGKKGGSIDLATVNDIAINGAVSANGHNDGGAIIFLAGGGLTVSSGGSVLAESANKKGGRIEAVIGGAGDISGALSVDGKGGEGLVAMTLQGDMTVGGAGLISANSTGPGKDGGTIGIKVGGNALYNGIVRANATGDGKIIALWSEGSTAIGGTAGGMISSIGGAEGGVIDITTRATLSGDGAIDASGTVNGSIIQRAVANSFAGAATPAAITESIILSDIVLNEIIPNPAGDDAGSAALPLDGEWMELYNKSGAAVDVNNWVLKDADGNTLTIASAKGDNDGDLSDAGETIAPAGGTLTVYRNGAGGLTLNNNGDTVQLLTDTLVLVDSFTYVVNVGEGNSIARMPDGIGAWVDPEPTPAALNGGINIGKLKWEFLERLNAAAVDEEEAVVEEEEKVEEPKEEEVLPAEENSEAPVDVSESIVETVISEEKITPAPEAVETPTPAPEETLSDEPVSEPIILPEETEETNI